jgi:hypothetical protein
MDPDLLAIRNILLRYSPEEGVEIINLAMLLANAFIQFYRQFILLLCASLMAWYVIANV